MLQKTIFILIISLSLLLIISCNQEEQLDSSIYEQKITKDNLNDLIKKVSLDKSISNSNMDYITTGITRLTSLKSDTIIGKSLKDIINVEKEFAKEQSSATLLTQTTKVNLVLNHEFKFAGLIPRDTMGKTLNLIIIDVTNKGSKEMKDIQGNLQFFDQNGQIIKSYPIEIKQILNGKNIPVGKSQQIVIPYTHDNTNVRDEMIRNDLKSMRAVWVANVIEWTDGTKLSVLESISK